MASEEEGDGPLSLNSDPMSASEAEDDDDGNVSMVSSSIAPIAAPGLNIGRYGAAPAASSLLPPKEQSQHFRPASPAYLDIPGGSDAFARSRSNSHSSREPESDAEQAVPKPKKKRNVNFDASGYF